MTRPCVFSEVVKYQTIINVMNLMAALEDSIDLFLCSINHILVWRPNNAHLVPRIVTLVSYFIGGHIREGRKLVNSR
jgi:hypothetical protein